jgi:hypothetical protein
MKRAMSIVSVFSALALLLSCAPSPLKPGLYAAKDAGRAVFRIAGLKAKGKLEILDPSSGFSPVKDLAVTYARSKDGLALEAREGEGDPQPFNIRFIDKGSFELLPAQAPVGEAGIVFVWVSATPKDFPADYFGPLPGGAAPGLAPLWYEGRWYLKTLGAASPPDLDFDLWQLLANGYWDIGRDYSIGGNEGPGTLALEPGEGDKELFLTCATSGEDGEGPDGSWNYRLVLESDEDEERLAAFGRNSDRAAFVLSRDPSIMFSPAYYAYGSREVYGFGGDGTVWISSGGEDVSMGLWRAAGDILAWDYDPAGGDDAGSYDPESHWSRALYFRVADGVDGPTLQSLDGGEDLYYEGSLGANDSGDYFGDDPGGPGGPDEGSEDGGPPQG